ncbi:bifunctional biotin--[acetyl-CoA-carboxylase] ligase/biotin operon repressor BirA [BEV proteobacterium]|nr:bifunctional biotin--[acetyl-CoA-carboxylase] ligase/biotin operon repressor BirA [Candidatus Symbiopectobacterium sp. Chty_BC]
MKDIRVPLTLIKILSDGEFYSGEYLGELLGISRAGINKHIQTIREWGLDVFPVTGKGYSLPEPMQLLDENVIRAALPANNVAVLPVIDSTNQYLLDRLESLHSGDACVAEYQQAGRGRRGRQWQSPFGANLYLSMFWRLEQGPAAAGGVSLAISIVIAEVLHRLGAHDVKVKWPNDLYMHDRKLAGILVELMGKTVDAAQLVIGIGINLRMRVSSGQGVTQEWINLQEARIDIDRNILAATLVTELSNALEVFEQGGLRSFIPRWQAIDNYYNRPVKLIMGEREIHGIERGIDEQCALLLEENGEIKAYIGGEISLRGK